MTYEGGYAESHLFETSVDCCTRWFPDLLGGCVVVVVVDGDDDGDDDGDGGGVEDGDDGEGGGEARMGRRSRMTMTTTRAGRTMWNTTGTTSLTWPIGTTTAMTTKRKEGTA